MKQELRWLLAACVFTGCARALPPPGGDPDREPPRLLSTKPEQNAIVPGFKDNVEFIFDETLSEKGVRDAVLVSPETGRAVLERDGAKLKVSIGGGWKPNTIYRVIILAGIQDRFNNARKEPTELVFSTGPQLISTAIGGLVTDRITGRPVAETRVTAVAVNDSVVHATVTDTAGFFGLRFLPVNRYNVTAYEDQNKNKKLDPNEKFAQESINIGTARDTQAVEMSLLARDTTPARLLRAEARDSLDVHLIFDDYLQPEQPTAVQVFLFQLPDSTAVAGARVITLKAAEEARARRDSLARVAARDSAAKAAARDTTVKRPPAAALPRPPVGLPPGGVGGARPVLPQEMVLVPAQPLKPSTRYRVEIHGVLNINNVQNGGGSVSFTTLQPVKPDSTAVRRDTARVRRDTIQTSLRRP